MIVRVVFTDEIVLRLDVPDLKHAADEILKVITDCNFTVQIYTIEVVDNNDGVVTPLECTWTWNLQLKERNNDCN